MTKPKSPLCRPPEELSDEELHLLERKLAAERMRRRVGDGPVTMDDMEHAADEDHVVSRDALQELVESVANNDLAKPCPKCGRMIRVHAKGRPKTFTTTKGKIEVRRNYHYCRRCRFGFYPLDRQLDLPDEGKTTASLQRRILDFCITDSFEATEQRWSIHYPFPISSNLARLVTDRVGKRCESSDEDYLQHALRNPSPTRAHLAIVQADGSMVSTREDGWREVKVGMVFRAENHLSNKESKRGQITQARYVAVLGGQESFKAKLDSAIRTECRKKPTTTLWMGDGALGNWRLARELVPIRRVDILDWKHALDHSLDCAKSLLADAPSLTNDWQRTVAHLLRYHEPEGVMEQLLACLEMADTADDLAALDGLVRYYRNNLERMRYRHFIELGYPISSGPVESAHKHVIQKRMKMAGQRWSMPRAVRMAAMRAAYATAGPRDFHHAIRLAANATQRHSKVPWHVRRTASNR